jgi:2'-5' RNA ligase
MITNRQACLLTAEGKVFAKGRPFAYNKGALIAWIAVFELLTRAGKTPKIMGRKAVDIVLLPTGAMTDIAIEANRQLTRQCDEKIVLDRDNCLPHISLAMGCLDESDLSAAAAILKDIAEELRLPELQITGIQASTNSAGEIVSVFAVKNIRELQSLHEEIMGTFSPYLTSDVTKEMLYNPDEIELSTLRWIENYRENSGFENFFPHITIGYGELSGGTFPIKFNASRLALCHLGNHCTCRKVLAAVQIATPR